MKADACMKTKVIMYRAFLFFWFCMCHLSSRSVKLKRNRVCMETYVIVWHYLRGIMLTHLVTCDRLKKKVCAVKSLIINLVSLGINCLSKSMNLSLLIETVPTRFILLLFSCELHRRGRNSTDWEGERFLLILEKKKMTETVCLAQRTGRGWTDSFCLNRLKLVTLPVLTAASCLVQSHACRGQALHPVPGRSPFARLHGAAWGSRHRSSGP